MIKKTDKIVTAFAGSASGPGMPGKKVTHLSQHTLNRLWGWCLANDQDPMSIAFFGACYACQSMQCAKMGDRLRESWPKPGEGDKWGGWLRAAYALGDDVHAYRDALGGEIIDMLKRENAWDNINPNQEEPGDRIPAG